MNRMKPYIDQDWLPENEDEESEYGSYSTDYDYFDDDTTYDPYVEEDLSDVFNEDENIKLT